MLDSYSCTVIIFQVIFYLCLSFRVNRLAVQVVYGLLYCLPCFMEPLPAQVCSKCLCETWKALVLTGLSNNRQLIWNLFDGILCIDCMSTDGKSLTGWMPLASHPWIFDCVLIDVCLIRAFTVWPISLVVYLTHWAVVLTDEADGHWAPDAECSVSLTKD